MAGKRITGGIDYVNHKQTVRCVSLAAVIETNVPAGYGPVKKIPYGSTPLRQQRCSGNHYFNPEIRHGCPLSKQLSGG